MRVGILSDTHGDLRAAISAYEAMGDVGELVHAGDYYQDAVDLSAVTNLKVHAVKGNCDWAANGPEEAIFELASWRIFLTHGHNYGVKYGFEELAKKAKNLKVNIAVFGHTHYPAIFVHDDILFLNPGSCSRPRGGGVRSFGIVSLGEQEAAGEILNISGQIEQNKSKQVRKL